MLQIHQNSFSAGAGGPYDVPHGLSFQSAGRGTPSPNTLPQSTAASLLDLSAYGVLGSRRLRPLGCQSSNPPQHMLESKLHQISRFLTVSWDFLKFLTRKWFIVLDFLESNILSVFSRFLLPRIIHCKSRYYKR